MTTLSKAIAMGLLLVLSSCTPPPTELSFYNNSGRDLAIPMEDGSTLSWMSDSYLNFKTMGSAVLRREEQGLILQVADTDGTATRYALQRNDAELIFRFVGTNRGADPSYRREPAYVTHEPMHACFQLRIDADMALYWMGRNCGKIVLKDARPQKQPNGFPLRHADPPPPYAPDPRSVRM